jgi:hypothetical protein
MIVVVVAVILTVVAFGMYALSILVGLKLVEEALRARAMLSTSPPHSATPHSPKSSRCSGRTPFDALPPNERRALRQELYEWKLAYGLAASRQFVDSGAELHREQARSTSIESASPFAAARRMSAC